MDNSNDIKILLLIDIPIELLSTLLTSYLDITSLVSFDTAFAYKEKRKLLQVAMSGMTTYCLDSHRHNLKSLWWLSLRQMTTNLSRLKYQSDVTDIILSSLSLCYIKHIDLQGCKHITSISCLRRCRQLSELNCNELLNLKDDSIKAVTEGCKDLSKIYINDCIHLTDASIFAITNNCPLLKVLFMIRCFHISDDGIKSLMKTPMLTELGLAHCSKITDNGIDIITQHCHDLEILNLISCSNLTDLSVCH